VREQRVELGDVLIEPDARVQVTILGAPERRQPWLTLHVKRQGIVHRHPWIVLHDAVKLATPQGRGSLLVPVPSGVDVGFVLKGPGVFPRDVYVHLKSGASGAATFDLRADQHLEARILGLPGEARGGHWVTLRDPAQVASLAPWTRTRTRADGSFAFFGMPAGPYALFLEVRNAVVRLQDSTTAQNRWRLPLEAPEVLVPSEEVVGFTVSSAAWNVLIQVRFITFRNLDPGSNVHDCGTLFSTQGLLGLFSGNVRQMVCQ